MSLVTSTLWTRSLKRKTTDDSSTSEDSEQPQKSDLWRRPKPDAVHDAAGPRHISYNFHTNVTKANFTPDKILLSMYLHPEVKRYLQTRPLDSLDSYVVSVQYGVKGTRDYKGTDIQIAHISGSENPVDRRYTRDRNLTSDPSRSEAIHRETMEELRAYCPHVARHAIFFPTPPSKSDVNWTFFESQICALVPVPMDMSLPYARPKDDIWTEKVACIFTGSYADVRELIRMYSTQYQSSGLSQGSDNIVAIWFFRVDVALEACRLIEAEQAKPYFKLKKPLHTTL